VELIDIFLLAGSPVAESIREMLLGILTGHKRVSPQGKNENRAYRKTK
jgi:hypothetical protein